MSLESPEAARILLLDWGGRDNRPPLGTPKGKQATWFNVCEQIASGLEEKTPLTACQLAGENVKILVS